MALLQEHQPSDRRHWLRHGRECEYGTERNRRIFCRIELAVPLWWTNLSSRAMATTAPDTRLAAVSRAKKSSIRTKPVARIRRRSALLRATARLLRHPEPYRQPLPRFSLSHLKWDQSCRLLLQRGCPRAVCLNHVGRS